MRTWSVLSKQHYVLDVVAGMFLASVACGVFLQGWWRDQVPERDQQVAPVMAFGATGIAGMATLCLWLAYRFNVS